jgi:hypothetical protein
MVNVKLYYGYITTSTIDANKHPNEQLTDLIKLIQETTNGELHIYCNSPYVLNMIRLIQAYTSKSIPFSTDIKTTNQHFEDYRVFLGSSAGGGIKTTNQHFEVLKNGDIVEGGYYKAMISDVNLLNDKLGESNDNFIKLLELEDNLKLK